MQISLEELVDKRDPEGLLRFSQHELLNEALHYTGDRLIKVICLLSQVSMQIKECSVNEQVLCTKFIHNLVDNIDQYTEPEVAAMFKKNLYGYEQH